MDEIDELIDQQVQQAAAAQPPATAPTAPPAAVPSDDADSAFEQLGRAASEAVLAQVASGNKYIEDAAFATNIDIVQDSMERTPEGFLHVQVTVRNSNQHDYRCQYRFEWKTEQGMVQTHAHMPWRPAVLHGRDVTPLEAVSPLQGTADFRLSIRRADEW